MGRVVVDGASREERAASLAMHVTGLYSGEPTISETLGGRLAALHRLRTFKFENYTAERNYVVGGTVSRLSPYLRHGALNLAEVRDTALRRVGPVVAHKFISELAWRFYWHLVYQKEGANIYQELEQPKYDRPRSHELPHDIEEATTGFECIDRSLSELYSDGYMHNHARMWFASYLIHHRGVHFSIGARLFDQHLLCGDPASNWLSWQWIDSSFSHKPYIFNKENVQRFSRGTYCEPCPARDACPFDASYPTLWRHLFGTEMPER